MPDLKGALKDLEEREAVCDEHGTYRSTRGKLFGRLMQWTGCPKCDEEREAQEKAAEQAARHEAIQKRAGIPTRFKNKGLDDYNAENPSQQKTLMFARVYADQFADQLQAGRCMTFTGKAGTGKTHLAIGVMKRVIEQGFTARYVQIYEVIEAIRETWRKDADRTECQVIAEFASVDLLVLDEVGVQYGKESEQVEIFKVLNRRYLDVRPTLVLSNVAVEDLKNCLGERVFDRLRENGGKFVPFDWESERARK